MIKTFFTASVLSAVASAQEDAMTDSEKAEALTIQAQAQDVRSAFYTAYQTDSKALGDKYPEFAQGMAHYGYSWEAVEVTTEDGALVTMFHVTGKHGSEWYKSTRPEVPVLVMHGSFMDGATWLNALRAPDFGESKNTPLPLFVWNEGFDVWIGNQRGTRYSNPNNDDSGSVYWDRNIGSDALDTIAFIEKIKEATGKEKVNIVGLEHGNAQAIYAMT